MGAFSGGENYYFLALFLEERWCPVFLGGGGPAASFFFLGEEAGGFLGERSRLVFLRGRDRCEGVGGGLTAGFWEMRPAIFSF